MDRWIVIGASRRRDQDVDGEGRQAGDEQDSVGAQVSGLKPAGVTSHEDEVDDAVGEGLPDDLYRHYDETVGGN